MYFFQLLEYHPDLEVISSFRPATAELLTNQESFNLGLSRRSVHQENTGDSTGASRVRTRNSWKEVGFDTSAITATHLQAQKVVEAAATPNTSNSIIEHIRARLRAAERIKLVTAAHALAALPSRRQSLRRSSALRQSHDHLTIDVIKPSVLHENSLKFRVKHGYVPSFPVTSTTSTSVSPQLTPGSSHLACKNDYGLDILPSDSSLAR
jgi:hypothetical protein